MPVSILGGHVPFSKFELCLLVPFAVLDAVLGISSAIYIVKHSGTIKPLAITILCSSGFLLILIVLVAVYRARRRERCRDIESSLKQYQPISTSTTTTQKTEYRNSLEKEGASISMERRPSPGYSPTLAFKVYFAVRRAFSPSLPPRRMFKPLDDKERLLFHDEAKLDLYDDSEDCSSERSSNDRRRSGLWTSVFELAGDGRLDQFRFANLKRLSKESRHSKYELCAESDIPPKIVITKPEPTASPPRSRRGSSDFGHPGEAPLSFDPLRSHPFQVLESTLQQSKSLQDLKLLSVNSARRSKTRRSRSAEPTSPGQPRLGRELPKARSAVQQVAPKSRMLPVIVLEAAESTYSIKPPSSTQLPRGLRKIASPGKDGQTLRKAFREGI